MEHIYKQYAVLAIKWKRDVLLRARVKLTLIYVGVSILILGVFSYLLYGALLSGLSESINEDVLDLTTQSYLFERASAAFQSRILKADAIALLFVLISGHILTGITLRPIRIAQDRERRFLADAAHELRTPLAVMKSGTEVILRSETNMSLRVKKAFIENINEIDSLTRIANGLLSLAHEKEKLLDKTIVSDASKVLRDVVEKLLPLAEVKHVSLTLVPLDMKHGVYVHADTISLARIFENTIENAIKYTNAGGSIMVTFKHQYPSLHVSVEDTGIGISESDLTHVTEPFFRADLSRTISEGSGLGLSIVLETIDSLGGSFHIESTLGVGTTVRISLPVSRAHTSLPGVNHG